MISIRWIQTGLVAAIAMAGMVVASADGSGSGGAGSGHSAMQAAFAACAKAQQGDSCQFVGRRDRLVQGTCQVPREGGSKLICRRNRRGGNGNGGGGGGDAKGSGTGSGK